ncbi:hypothetical protein D3C85_1526820 [compost metagenome]
MDKNLSSLSIEIKVAVSSIPSSIQEVDSPVPVPSSKKAPPGFEAANVLSNEQVSTSEAIENSEFAVASLMAM